jgi:hypothetical protein
MFMDAIIVDEAENMEVEENDDEWPEGVWNGEAPEDEEDDKHEEGDVGNVEGNYKDEGEFEHG